jgi:DNA-binding MarR family transcriptional regulator
MSGTNERQDPDLSATEQRVLENLSNSGGTTLPKISVDNRVAPDEAEHALKELQQKGYVQTAKPPRGTRLEAELYEPTEAGRQMSAPKAPMSSLPTAVSTILFGIGAVLLVFSLVTGSPDPIIPTILVILSVVLPVAIAALEARR